VDGFGVTLLAVGELLGIRLGALVFFGGVGRGLGLADGFGVTFLLVGALLGLLLGPLVVFLALGLALGEADGFGVTFLTVGELLGIWLRVRAVDGFGVTFLLVGELLGTRLGALVFFGDVGRVLGLVDGFGVTFLLVGELLGTRLGALVFFGDVGRVLGLVDGLGVTFLLVGELLGIRLGALVFFVLLGPTLGILDGLGVNFLAAGELLGRWLGALVFFRTLGPLVGDVDGFGVTFLMVGELLGVRLGALVFFVALGPPLGDVDGLGVNFLAELGELLGVRLGALAVGWLLGCVDVGLSLRLSCCKVFEDDARRILLLFKGGVGPVLWSDMACWLVPVIHFEATLSPALPVSLFSLPSRFLSFDSTISGPASASGLPPMTFGEISCVSDTSLSCCCNCLSCGCWRYWAPDIGPFIKVSSIWESFAFDDHQLLDDVSFVMPTATVDESPFIDPSESIFRRKHLEKSTRNVTKLQKQTVHILVVPGWFIILAILELTRKT
jgi:hypothetical protein